MPKDVRIKPLKFDSESLLQQAIAGLLSKMPNVTGVQILQGAQEYGKDIIFYVPGGLTDKLLFACVVKNTKITGQVAANSGARTVLLQAQQALDTPHVAGAGADEWVQRVYVVTPYPIDPSASLAIQGGLKERRGQVVFVGGPQLFDLFRKYWPDFVADEADAISRYIANAKDTFEQSYPISEVASMYQLGMIDKRSTWIHVPQLLERTISSFRPGDAVELLIPDPDLVWKKKNLKNATNNLLRLDSALRTVAEWGFWDLSDAKAFNRDTLHQCTQMEAAWRKAIHERYRVAIDAVDRVGPDAAVAFGKDSGIHESLDNLRSRSNMALIGGIDRASKLAAEVIREDAPPKVLLSDDRFLQVCGLTDLACVLPPGFLEQESSRTWQFEPGHLKDSRSLLIVGAAGYGKTSFCRWSFLVDAEHLNSGASQRIPVYIALHKMSSVQPRTFDDMYSSAVGRSGLVGPIEEADVASARVYLDGLDEIADERIREKVVALAQQGAKSYPGLQIVLTSRSYVQGPWLRWLPRLSLSGFTTEQIDRFVHEWLGGREDEIARFKSQLKATPMLEELMRVPLIATLVILVFRQTGRLPESRSRVYDVFIDLMCEGWNLAKRLLRTSKFGLRVKKAVLGRVAIIAHRQKSRVFKGDDIKDAIEACVAQSVCGDWNELKDELLEEGLISRSGAHFEFAHLSFQEFLAAKELLGEPTHSQLVKALNDYLRGDDWWLEALRFYVGLSASPRQTYDWIVKQADKLSGSYEDILDATDPEERAEALLRSVKEHFPESPMAL